MGWTGSAFYIWFGNFDEKTLRPFFIRNYDRDVVILEDEYQAVLKIKFNAEQELADLAERVDVIKRTTSVALFNEKTGRTTSRFMSMAPTGAMGRNMSMNPLYYNPNKKPPTILREDSMKVLKVPDRVTHNRDASYSIQKEDRPE